MKKILFFMFLAGLILVSESEVALAAAKEEVEELLDFTIKTTMPQQGPHGNVMFVLSVQGLKRPYGYENIFFRVHDGGNRFYVTMFRKEVYILPGGGRLVKSIKIVDGGSIASNNDEFGQPDGKPDQVVFNGWIIAPDGLILEEMPEKFLDLAGKAEYEQYLKIYDEGIKEIKNPSSRASETEL